MRIKGLTKLGLLCAAVLVVAALALPASSFAVDGGFFCGTNTSYYTIPGGGGKCIHNVYHTVYSDIDGNIPGSYLAKKVLQNEWSRLWQRIAQASVRNAWWIWGSRS